MPMAAFALTLDTKPGKMLYASRGTVKPTIKAPAAYANGMSQAGRLRKLRATCLLGSASGCHANEHGSEIPAIVNCYASRVGFCRCPTRPLETKRIRMRSVAGGEFLY